MRWIKGVLIIACAALYTTQKSSAQYYSWGADRASLTWSKFQGDSVSLIFPSHTEQNARRTMHYIDIVRKEVGYGFKHPAMNIPFVTHAENFASNGMVMWAPLRIEFLSTPAVDGFTMPWIKQLTAHEYRHAVQYNNLNQSTLKVFSYLFGQQASAASLLFPPLYALEGDAVMFETQSSTYGRALQPSFTMAYRALADELLDKRDYMKWRCGSYLQDIPNHYNMGYQMMAYAYDKYGENILDRSFEYIARNPQFILPYHFALRKFYDTSSRELFYETFSSLVDFWDEASKVENSAELLSGGEERNVITYSHPMALLDDNILLVCSDYKEPERFVLYDAHSQNEKTLAHTGVISTRPSYANGRVWWTEYRRSMLFAEDVNSQLCYMDLASCKPCAIKRHHNALYATPIGDTKDHVAYVEYATTGQYSIVELLNNEEIHRVDIPYPNEVHAMAWDDKTERLYIIITGEGGMWIEQIEGNASTPITQAAHVTLSNLRASEGKLYFGSIASGKDEVHSLDIESGVQRQVTESKYGSFQGIALGDQIYMTTYDKYGYHLSRQDAKSYIREVNFSATPKNVVNPTREKWDVVNLDTIRFDSCAVAISEQRYKKESYNKASHLFNLHSWAPVRFDPFNILNEMSLDVGLGATLVSQNLLSTCDGFLSYGWDKFQGSIVNGGVNYSGLGVNLSLSGTYGGVQNVYMVNPSLFNLDRYRSVSLSATLPLYFNRGYISRALSIYGGWSYSNGIVPTGLKCEYYFDVQSGYKEKAIAYDGASEGLNKISAGISYSSYVRAAYRDIAPPLGYMLNASFATDPFNTDFSTLLSLSGKVYTPGLLKNNSFTIAAAYQESIGGFQIDGMSPLGYVSSVLVPHGFSFLDVSNSNYLAASANYKFPLCYPEIGVLDIIYLKRLSLGLGVDYAQFQKYNYNNNSIYSYGVDLSVDFNAISLASASTMSTTLSLYKPKDRDLYFQIGMSLPF